MATVIVLADRGDLRAQMFAALAAMPWPPTQANAAGVVGTLQPLYDAAVAQGILGTEATTLSVWIGEWTQAP
jgi:hypothetical protein